MEEIFRFLLQLLEKHYKAYLVSLPSLLKVLTPILTYSFVIPGFQGWRSEAAALQGLPGRPQHFHRLRGVGRHFAHHGQRQVPGPMSLSPVERRQPPDARGRVPPEHCRVEGGKNVRQDAAACPVQKRHDGAIVPGKEETFIRVLFSC